MYVDPDGEFAWVIPVIIGIGSGVYNVIQNKDDIHGFWSGAGYFTAGFAGGCLGTLAASTGIGILPAMGVGSMVGGLTSGTLGGVFRTIDKGLNFQNFEEGFFDSYDSGSFGGSIGGAYYGAINAGHLSKASGVSVDIWTGKGADFARKTIKERIITGNTNYSYNQITKGEIHHVFPYKNKTWTYQYKDITNKYDFDLNGPQNKMFIPGHRGRHPKEYLQWLLRELMEIDRTSNGDKEIFMKLYKEKIWDSLKKEPGMVHKWWWINK